MIEKTDIVKRVSEASGLEPREVMPVLRLCRWDVMRISEEFERHGAKWFERAKDDAMDWAAIFAVSRVGPLAMRKLSGERIGKHVETPLLNRFAENYRGGNALLLGPTRVGKSLTAFRALRLARYRKVMRELKADPEWPRRAAHYVHTRWREGDSDVDPYFLDGWTDALGLNRARMEHPLGQGECFAVEGAKNAGLIVIDEIGLPRNDDLALEILWHRYNAGKYTIVTAGMNRMALQKRFGDAAIARMLESNGQQGVIVDCYGK